MKLSDFQDKLLSLAPQDFERFVVDLLQRSGRFKEVRLSGPGPDRGIDIEALEIDPLVPTPRKWYFQVKRVKVAGSDIVRYVVPLLASLRAVDPKVEVVLVLAGNITRAAIEQLHRFGIEVWDSVRLFELTTPDLFEYYFGEEPVRREPDSGVEVKATSFAAALEEIEPGKSKWSAYQRLAADILEFLFCPPLEPPRYELSDAEARNRRDVILENSAPDGLWAHLRLTYAAHYIVADAKNYVDPIKKAPVLDIAHYLKPYGCGMFALLLTRKGAGNPALHAVREQWIGSQKMIVVLADSQVKEMLSIKAAGGRPEEIIRRAIADLRMHL